MKIGCVDLDYKSLIVNNWITFIFGLISVGIIAFCKQLSKKIHKQFCDQQSLKNGTLALLRSEIIHCYDKYIDKGWIPLYGLENVLDLYESYHDLGGNGAITKLVLEIKELPSVGQK